MMHEKTDWSRLNEPKEISINQIRIENKFGKFSISRTTIKHQLREAKSFEHKGSQFRLVKDMV